MYESFFEKSKKISNDFIKNVLFVDDEIYSSKANKDHNLDAEQLIHAFSKAKKLCALNNPRNESDFENIVEVAKMADITVLDWRIELENTDFLDESADVEEIDPRGEFTLRLIKEIISDPFGQGAMKLILVYTGETILKKIVETIYTELKGENFCINGRYIEKENIKIIVAGKPSLRGRLRHNPDIEDWIVDSADVPNFLVEEFSQMTKGLISNFALQCLNTIRDNTFRIVKLFNKDIDAAYLGHKVLLPDSNDAELYMVSLLKDCLGDLLHYFKANTFIDKESIVLWIKDELIKEDKKYLNRKSQLFSDENGLKLDVCYKVNEELVSDLLFQDEMDVAKKFTTSFKKNNLGALKNKANKSEFIDHIQLNSTSIFSKPENIDKSNAKFAKLSHHKNLFKPNSYQPKLSQGTVIKGKESNLYWVCIQQKCDSVRLPDSPARRFLFLPLKEVDGNNKFNFLTPDDVKLKLIIKSFELRTIKFQPTNPGENEILAIENGSSFIFTPFYASAEKENAEINQEEFYWSFDLKDLHSQRIINDYATTLSRVGLDETEWLRRWAP